MKKHSAFNALGSYAPPPNIVPPPPPVRCNALFCTPNQTTKETTMSDKCKCWEEKDEAIQLKYGLKISPACSVLHMGETAVTVKRALPLVQLNGKAPNNMQAKFVTISHCPWCGKAL